MNRLCLTALILWPAFVNAQRLRPGIDPQRFVANSHLVLVPVTVTDRRGSVVNGLERRQFTVSEDGVAQSIASFSEEESATSIGVVFDRSGSMREVLPAAKNALKEFFEVANPEDEAFITAVSTRPQVHGGFTHNLGQLLTSVAFEDASGSTALVDTLFKGLDSMKASSNPRRALVVISDGMDNHSRQSASQLMRKAVEADIPVYTVSFFGPSPSDKAAELAEQGRGLLFLRDLSTRTGGLSYVVRSGNDLLFAIAEISKAIRNQYVIGYVPGKAVDGRWRKIKINVAPGEMQAHARYGYRIE